MAHALYKGEDFNVKWTGLIDSEAASYLNAATVTFTLKDAAGAAVTGGNGTSSYVAASNGNYLGVLQSSRSDVLGQKYRLEIVAVQGDYNARRVLELICEERGEE